MDHYSANLTSDNGDSFIPASQRPDGTWRKARRVKGGYVPQEEVPLYESKGKQFVNRASKPATVTLPTGEVARQAIPGLFVTDNKEKEQKVKGKKKNKESINVNEMNGQIANIKLKDTPTPQGGKCKSSKEEKSKKANEKKQVESCESDPAKKLKNLKKRLREIQALEEKIKNGSIKPDSDQLKKVARKNDLQSEVKILENI